MIKMTMCRLLGAMGRIGHGFFAAGAGWLRKSRGSSYATYLVDTLEPRLLMTAYAYSWAGGADSQFLNRNNWVLTSGGAGAAVDVGAGVAGDTFDLTIGDSNAPTNIGTLTLSSSVTIQSLTVEKYVALNLSGNNLSISNALTVDAPISNNAALTVLNPGITVRANANTISMVTLNIATGAAHSGIFDLEGSGVEAGISGNTNVGTGAAVGGVLASGTLEANGAEIAATASTLTLGGTGTSDLESAGGIVTFQNVTAASPDASVPSEIAFSGATLTISSTTSGIMIDASYSAVSISMASSSELTAYGIDVTGGTLPPSVSFDDSTWTGGQSFEILDTAGFHDSQDNPFVEIDDSTLDVAYIDICADMSVSDSTLTGASFLAGGPITGSGTITESSFAMSDSFDLFLSGTPSPSYALNVNASTITIGGYTPGPHGTPGIYDGTLTTDAATSVTIDGASRIQAGPVYISGDLKLQGASEFDSTAATVFDSNNTIVVDGAGTLWHNFINPGGGGSMDLRGSTFNITNGAMVETDTLVLPHPATVDGSIPQLSLNIDASVLQVDEMLTLVLGSVVTSAQTMQLSVTHHGTITLADGSVFFKGRATVGGDGTYQIGNTQPQGVGTDIAPGDGLIFDDSGNLTVNPDSTDPYGTLTLAGGEDGSLTLGGILDAASGMTLDTAIAIDGSASLLAVPGGTVTLGGDLAGQFNAVAADGNDAYYSDPDAFDSVATSYTLLTAAAISGGFTTYDATLAEEVDYTWGDPLPESATAGMPELIPGKAWALNDVTVDGQAELQLQIVNAAIPDPLYIIPGDQYVTDASNVLYQNTNSVNPYGTKTYADTLDESSPDYVSVLTLGQSAGQSSLIEAGGFTPGGTLSVMTAAGVFSNGTSSAYAAGDAWTLVDAASAINAGAGSYKFPAAEKRRERMAA